MQPSTEETRFCKRCEKHKPKARFLAWATRGGAVQHRGHCLDCRETYAEERAAELVEYRRQYNVSKRSVIARVALGIAPSTSKCCGAWSSVAQWKIDGRSLAAELRRAARGARG
jgi:hypothetical protein